MVPKQSIPVANDRRANRARRRGFTLLELLIVIVLIGMLMAFGWGNFDGYAKSQELGESVLRIKAAVAMCRAEAMNYSRRYRFSIRPSGELRITRQLDPIEAPHEFVAVQSDWIRTTLLQESAWVESVQSLPSGPPPIDVPQDEELAVDGVAVEFSEFGGSVVPITELEAAFDIEFQPDGSSNSARWVLRDAGGYGVEMTLDGRLGRVSSKPVDVLGADQIERPQLPEEKEETPTAETGRKTR